MPDDKTNNKSDSNREIPFSEKYDRSIGKESVIDTLPPPNPTPPQNDDKEK